jgi:hypothetical protein
MSEHREDWGVYIKETDGGPTSLTVDLGWMSSCPDREKTALLMVRLACHRRGENGFPTQEELAALYALEDQVLAHLTPMGWAHVGTIQTGARRELVLYGPAKRAKDVDFGFVPVERRGDPFVRAAQDQTWDFYRSVLYPDAGALQKIKDDRVLKTLAEHGDVAEIRRRVDHWAYFPSAGKRHEFAATVERMGYAIEGVSDPGETSDRYGVAFFHTSEVTPEQIHAVTTVLNELATEMGGEYDGWETQVMRRKASLWKRMLGRDS